MAYEKQTWIAPEGNGLTRYAKSGETETHIELALDPVNLTNTPTPITVARLNHMEDGIAKAYDTAKLATQALAIKPLGNAITLPATPTSVKRIIKIATVDWKYNGSINIVCTGAYIDEAIKVHINGGRAIDSGLRLIYGKNGVDYGIKKIIVTSDTTVWSSNRQIYAEMLIAPNYPSTTTLGVVETNRGTFTTSMTEVSSVEGTVVDSLSLDYLRGDISSYQHVFTKNIIGNVTGNASTATALATARKINNVPFDGTADIVTQEAPPTPWAQYSGKDIPQLPDNVAGATQKVTEFTSIPSGWVVNAGTPVSSFDDNEWQVVSNANIEGYYRMVPAGSVVIMYIKCISGDMRIHDSTRVADVKIYSASDKWNLFIYYAPTTRNLVHYSNSGTYRIKSIYIGTGAYDRLVFDNSYHYRHLLNNAVVPTQQGLYFNGETSYLRSKEKITLPDVFTFSATVNCAFKSTAQMFFAQGIYSATIPFLHIFRRANTNNLIVQVNNGTGIVDAFPANNFFTGLDNTDIKIETSVDFINKTIKVYRNGIQFGSVVSAPTMIKPVTDNIYYGDFVTGSDKLLGYMRNIYLFDTALTDTQRNWLAQGNTPPILYDVTNYEIGNAGTASKANVRVSLRHGDTWFAKTWTGLTNFTGNNIWTDGENIYYSSTTTQYVLNKATSTWSLKTWTGLTDFDGIYIWTDEENIYYSKGINQYVLDKTTATWTAKTWTGLTDFDGFDIWTDGENIYYSDGAAQVVLNKATSTWTSKAWFGIANVIGQYIWTDGENIYHSSGSKTYVLNKATSTWTTKTWTGHTGITGNRIWTDGENTYYSYDTEQFVITKGALAWNAKIWTGLPSFKGQYVWTDGENIYYSSGASQFVLPATRHNYVDDDKYNPVLGTGTRCKCLTLSDRFVFRNE